MSIEKYTRPRLSHTCEFKTEPTRKIIINQISIQARDQPAHLWQPGDKSKDEHPTIMLPVGRQVGRVAQAVRSDGEDDDAQELGEKDHMELVRKIYRF